MTEAELDRRGWRTPFRLLAIMSAAMPLAFYSWYGLLNNFVIERAQYTGSDIGLLQSVREIPGFLAFTAIYLIMVMKEQTLALISLFVLGLGVAITGFYASPMGLLFTTFLMSVGFHYFETIKKSLTLQWLSKETAPAQMGKLLAIGSGSSVVAYGLLWWQPFTYEMHYWLGGGACMMLAVAMWFGFPSFKENHGQNKTLFLRKRYWLYYALVFMSGARRQIFVVFAGFMMVEKFGFDVSSIAALYLLNHVINTIIAAPIGRWINRVGERTALCFEYIGLVLVFVAYAFVQTGELAAILYVVDHLFFSMAIAISTYFQKIADPKDIAATAGVSFTINHIAAVIIPVGLGLVWLVSPMAVFLLGALMAVISLFLALQVPRYPTQQID
jgi:hypothetical protein